MDKLKQLIKEYIRKLLLEAEGDQQPPQNPNQQQPQQPNQQQPQNPPQQQQQQPVQNPNVFYATTEQMADLIRSTKGKIFTVAFTKRSTNTERVMNARLGVKLYLRGGTLPYNPNQKGLIPCFDMQKKDYRMINISGISSLKIGKNIYVLPGTQF